MKNLVPHGNMVLLVFEEVKGSKSELFKPAAQGSKLLVPSNMDTGVPGAPANSDKPKYRARVSAVGDGIDLATKKWKVGDLVIYNDYDIKTFAPPEGGDVYGLIKAENIWATYED